MGEKEELEMDIETLRAQLENAEKRLWKINTKEWCVAFLEENK